MKKKLILTIIKRWVKAEIGLVEEMGVEVVTVVFLVEEIVLGEKIEIEVDQEEAVVEEEIDHEVETPKDPGEETGTKGREEVGTLVIEVSKGQIVMVVLKGTVKKETINCIGLQTL